LAVILVPHGTVMVLFDETAQLLAVTEVPPLSVTPLLAPSSARMHAAEAPPTWA